jgi:hypothetical protein
MHKNKIPESVHLSKLQVLITGSGAVHNVPLHYSVCLKKDFRISVLSRTFRKSTLFTRGQTSIKFWGYKIACHKVTSLSYKYIQLGF